MGDGEIAAGGEEMEAVSGHGGTDRRTFEPPVGNERVEAHRVHNRAGNDMAADLGGFFHDGDGKIGMALLEADGGGKSGGARSDDQHIGGKRFATARLCHGESILNLGARLEPPDGV